MAGKTEKSNDIFCYIRLGGKVQAKNNRLKAFEGYIEENNLREYSLKQYIETVSANVSARKREKLIEILSKIKKRDVLVVCERKDLGRDYGEIIDTITKIKKKQSKICIIEVPLLNNWQFVEDGEYYDDALGMLTDDLKETDRLDKLYRQLSTQRQMDLLREENKKVGRPVSPVPEAFKELYHQYVSGSLDAYCLEDFLKEAKISKQTYYNYLKKMREAGEIK